MYRRRPRRRSRIKRTINRIINRFLRLSQTKRAVILGGAAAVLVALILIVCLASSAPGNPVLAAGNMDVPPSETSVSTPIPTTEPTPVPTPTPTPDPTLKRGDENERVQQLQERLMELNYLDIDESTQFYGPATEYAVELFQRQAGLQQDGIAGPQTLSAIYSPDAQTYLLLEGTKGDDVDSLQRQLVDLGYLKKATGYYGTETVAAVKEFQSRNNLAVDGKTGPITLDAIYSPNAKPSKEKVQAEKRRANINEMISIAKKQLGKPYRIGHEGPDSFDCSGLVYYCLKKAGSSRGRYNAAGYSQVSNWDKITSMSKLQKGDLLFFWNKTKSKVGHVGIYIGGGMMIDASSSHGEVVKRSCNTAYWKKMFVCARRPW